MCGIIEILDVKINKVKMNEALQEVQRFIEEGGKNHYVVTPNSEMLVMAHDDPEFKEILNKADLSIPDGAGLLLASHLSKNKLEERVAGYDLMKGLFSLAVEKKYSIFLLGGRPGVVEKAYYNILREYPGISISGIHHGYLDMNLQESVIKKINIAKPDLLFIGMGVPLQERFISKNLSRLNIKVAITVGGGFDVLAGEVKRAPLWMQKNHLEWMFRLLKEPSRIGRMLALPRFVFLVLMRYIKGI
jgi:N-acetylglucosaminyldiphosphoundecaprenol N-acetyl-beta-D-mannosaminyltransferase